MDNSQILKETHEMVTQLVSMVGDMLKTPDEIKEKRKDFYETKEKLTNFNARIEPPVSE